MKSYMSATVFALVAPANFSAHAGRNGPQEVLSVGMHYTGHAMDEYAASGHSYGCATAGHEKLVLIEKTNPSFK